MAHRARGIDAPSTMDAMGATHFLASGSSKENSLRILMLRSSVPSSVNQTASGSPENVPCPIHLTLYRAPADGA